MQQRRDASRLAVPVTWTRRWAAGACVACAAAALSALIERERAEHARLDALAHDLVEAQTEIARLHASERSPLGVPQPLYVGATSLDPGTADAIAARVLAASEARARANDEIAKDANAPDPNQLVARAAAQRTVDTAIARGRLRVDDVVAVRQALASDPGGRAEVARQIAVALNTNKLVPDDPRAIFP